MKRFRAFLTSAPEPGGKVLVDGDAVTEEWDADKIVRNVPVRVVSADPRLGYVVRIIGLRDPDNVTDAHRGRWEVILEDPPPYQATVGAVLTVLFGTLLCPPRELVALLDFVSARYEYDTDPDDDAATPPPLYDAQYAAIADELRAHLSGTPGALPRGLRDAIEWIGTGVPTYDTAAEYAAYVDGIAQATGCHYGIVLDIPQPPIEIPPPPPEPVAPPDPTRMMVVRPDVLDQIVRHRGLN